MVNEIESFIPYVVFLGGIVTVATIAYNTGRKQTELQKDVDQLKLSHSDNVNESKKKHIEIEKNSELAIEKLRTELDQKIVKTVGNQKDEFSSIQRQIDSTRSDVKTLLARIEVNETKIIGSDKIHDELKQTDKENHKFHSDWNQRIEDTNKEMLRYIDAVRDQLIRMITAFHTRRKNGNS